MTHNHTHGSGNDGEEAEAEEGEEEASAVDCKTAWRTAVGHKLVTATVGITPGG